MRVDAVVRNLEVIGEAAKKLPSESRPRCLRFRGSASPDFAMS